MNVCSRIFVVLAFAISFAVSAAAKDAVEPNKATLIEAVDAFGVALNAGDFPTVVSTIPPEVLAAMASRAGVTPIMLRMVSTVQMKAVMSEVEFIDFGMDVENAELKTTEAGLSYAVLRTHTVMRFPETGMARGSSPTLAIFGDGRWYLLRIDGDAQIDLVRSVYPELRDVQFEKATVIFDDDVIEEAQDKAAE